MTRDQAADRLVACGMAPPDATIVVDHLAAADEAGKPGHGLSRIPWLEGLLAGSRDPAGRPERVERGDGFERWHGHGALGYVTLAAVCDALVADPPGRARLVVAESCFPTGVLGAWARQLAEAGSRRGRHRDLATAAAASRRRTAAHRDEPDRDRGSLVGRSSAGRGRLDGRGHPRRRARRAGRAPKSSFRSAGRRRTRRSRSRRGSSCSSAPSRARSPVRSCSPRGRSTTRCRRSVRSPRA